MPVDKNAHHYRTRYSVLCAEYGSMSPFVDELRDNILNAANQEQLTGVQRDELIAIVEEIDEERKALEGSA
jgi:hypothetical protein